MKKGNLKKYFFTGLFVMLPIMLTVVAITLLIEVIASLVRSVFPFLPQLPFNSEILLTLIILVLVTLLMGFLIIKFLDKRLEKFIDSIFMNVPVIKNLYSGTKKVTEAMFSESDKKAFKRVVLVPFPNKGIYSIGFVTQETVSFDKTLTMVFIPQAPLPNNGYVMAVKSSNLKNVNISVNEAIKIILSGGILDEQQTHKK